MKFIDWFFIYLSGNMFKGLHLTVNVAKNNFWLFFVYFFFFVYFLFFSIYFQLFYWFVFIHFLFLIVFQGYFLSSCIYFIKVFASERHEVLFVQFRISFSRCKCNRVIKCVRSMITFSISVAHSWHVTGRGIETDLWMNKHTN